MTDERSDYDRALEAILIADKLPHRELSRITFRTITTFGESITEELEVEFAEAGPVRAPSIELPSADEPF